MIVFSIPYVMASLVGMAVSLMKSTALIVLFPSAMVLESNTEQLPRIDNFRDTTPKASCSALACYIFDKMCPLLLPPPKVWIWMNHCF